MGRTTTGYYLMDGTLTRGRLIGTLVASNVSLGNMVYVCAIWGYSYGWSGVFWVAVCIIALTLGLIWAAPRFKGYIEDRNNSGSLHEYLQVAFDGGNPTKASRQFRFVTSAITLFSLLMALAIENHLCATILARILGWNEFLIVVLLTGFISLYSSRGGFKGVVYSDTAQAILFGIGLIMAFGLLYSVGNGNLHLAQFPSDIKSVVLGAGIPNAIGITVLGFGWTLVTADSWQRNCATRSLSTSVSGMAISGTILTITVIMCGIAGMAVKTVVEPNIPQGFAGSVSAGSLPWNDFFLLPQSTGLHVLLSLGLATGLFMAAISTTDTFLVVCSQTIVTDMLLGSGKGRSLGDLSEIENAKLTRIAQLTTGGIAVLVILCWVALKATKLLGDPVTLFYITYSVQFSLLVPVLITCTSLGRSRRAATQSVLAACIVTLAVGWVSWQAVLQGTKATVLHLAAADWLALLPVVTVFTGALMYAVVYAMDHKSNTHA